MKPQMLSAGLAVAADPQPSDAWSSPLEAEEAREVGAGARPFTTGSPVRPQVFERSWPFQSTTVRLARIHARTFLSMMSWAGDQDNAQRVAVELVKNAVQHVGPRYPHSAVTLNLTVTEDEELLITVTDPSLAFDGFAEVIADEKSTGLGLVRALGGDVSCAIRGSGDGKSVSVRMKPSAPSP